MTIYEITVSKFEWCIMTPQRTSVYLQALHFSELFTVCQFLITVNISKNKTHMYVNIAISR